MWLSSFFLGKAKGIIKTLVEGWPEVSPFKRSHTEMGSPKHSSYRCSVEKGMGQKNDRGERKKKG